KEGARGPVGDEGGEGAVAEEEREIAAGEEGGEVVDPELDEIGAAGLGGGHIGRHLIHRLGHQRHAQQRHPSSSLDLVMEQEEDGSSTEFIERRGGDEDPRQRCDSIPDLMLLSTHVRVRSLVSNLPVKAFRQTR
ncbi:hypothetical protein B296_00055251, partial [Ensete ventricosum]